MNPNDGLTTPVEWTRHLRAVDAALARVGAPLAVREGIARDVEAHLAELRAEHPDIHEMPDVALVARTDPPEAYAVEFVEAVQRRLAEAPETPTPTAALLDTPPFEKKPMPGDPVPADRARRRCAAPHRADGDGDRSIHICAKCLRVFRGCAAYERHDCPGEAPVTRLALSFAGGRRRPGAKRGPPWPALRRRVWTLVLAACLFLPLYGCIRHVYYDGTAWRRRPTHRRYAGDLWRTMESMYSALRVYVIEHGVYPPTLEQAFAATGAYGEEARMWMQMNERDAYDGQTDGFDRYRFLYLLAGERDTPAASLEPDALIVAYAYPGYDQGEVLRWTALKHNGAVDQNVTTAHIERALARGR